MNAQSKCDDLPSPLSQPSIALLPLGLFLSGSGRDDAGLARKTLPELPPKKVKSSQTPARLGELATLRCASHWERSPEVCIPLGALSTLRHASHWERSPH